MDNAARILRKAAIRALKDDRATRLRTDLIGTAAAPLYNHVIALSTAWLRAPGVTAACGLRCILREPLKSDCLGPQKTWLPVLILSRDWTGEPETQT